jgi:hypothetical protein
MYELISNIGVGTLGLLFYAVYNTRDYIVSGTFDFKKGMKENWKRMAWVETMIILLAIIYLIVPEAFQSMTGMDGLKVPEVVNKGSFFAISIGLAKYVKVLVKKNNSAIN